MLAPFVVLGCALAAAGADPESGESCHEAGSCAAQATSSVLLQVRSALATVDANILTRHLLPTDRGYAGGKCMHGDQAGYYYGPPSSGNSTTWVIFLKGGGACNSKCSCDKWNSSTYTDEDTGDDFGFKGSSSQWPPNMAGTLTLSSSPSINPDFHDAHHVYVPYCTGDTHAGNVTAPGPEQWGYFFDGHLNVEAILRNLYEDKPEFRQMTRLLFMGTSAGGKGVFHNCDFVQDLLTQGSISATVKCAPFSGWFVPGFTSDHADPQASPSIWFDFQNGDATESSFDLSSQQTYYPEECVSANPGTPEVCSSATEIYPHMLAPVYVAQDMYDFNQIQNQLGMPAAAQTTQTGHDYVAYFGEAMRNSTAQVINGKAGDGLFLTACYNHGSNMKLGGRRKWDGLGDWFWDRPVSHVTVDTCAGTVPVKGTPCGSRSGCMAIEQVSPVAPVLPDCNSKFMDLCEDDAITPQKCRECAQCNAPELVLAGCTVPQIQSTCAQAPL